MLKRHTAGAVLGLAMAARVAIGQIATPPEAAAPPTPVSDWKWPLPISDPPPADLYQWMGGSRISMWRDPKTSKLEELTEPLYWAALRKNQLVTPKVAEKLDEFLRQRKRQYERSLVDNVDRMRKVSEGLIERVREPDGPDSHYLIPLLNPLVGDSIREAIKKKGLLTQLQLDHQDKIVREYVKERERDIGDTFPDLAEGATPEAIKDRTSRLTKAKMRAHLYDFLDESTWAYVGLLNEVAMNWDGVLAKADLDAATKAALNTTFAEVCAAKDDKGRVAVMKTLVRSITPEQERKLLQVIIDARPAMPQGPAEKPAGGPGAL